MQKAKKFRAVIKAAFLFSIPLFYLYIILTTLHPALPSKQRPIIFYANQAGNDLKRTLLHAIKQAENSILLKAYGVTDRDLFKRLEQKKGIPIQIFYDPSASKHIDQQGIEATPIRCKGLMHQKIFLLDQKTTLIGSANLTKQSLKMHDNLIVGIHCPALAQFLENPTSTSASFIIKNQLLEAHLLPDKEAFTKVLSLLESAQKSITVAMFTFTHPILCEALIKARDRGVAIKVFLDRTSAHGTSKKIYRLLKENNIPIKTSKGIQLLHHKWALIDNKTLIFGSANWTKSAFKKNDECFFILHDLTKEQQKIIYRISK